MRKSQSYFYVGAQAIREKVDERYVGYEITRVRDVDDWVVRTNQVVIHEQLIATFVISEQESLLINDRHSEHVMCAGGRNVLSAGEVTFNFEDKEVFVSDISNQSTGYCPKVSSWAIVELVLNRIGMQHPGRFTRAFEFRYCEHCHNKNLVKDEHYECAICGAELDRIWNIDKIKMENY